MAAFLGSLVICLLFLWMMTTGLVEMATSRSASSVEPDLPPARVGRTARLPPRPPRDWSRFGLGLFKTILGTPVVLFTGFLYLLAAPGRFALFAGELLTLATIVAAVVVRLRRRPADRVAV
jgi:hypothetical protein